MTKFNCPHCGNPLKVIAQSGRRQISRPHWRRFQSTAPTGGLQSFLWWMTGKGESVPVEVDPPTEIVRVEQKSQGGRHWLLHDFNPAITKDVLYTVAYACRFLEDNYSGNTLMKKHGLTSTQWVYLNDGFKRMAFAEPLPNGANGFQLTVWGERFLDKCLHRFGRQSQNSGDVNNER
ncbi:hypothetical protein [Zhongshania sp.]|uniref:hypothetical protein n=1 Tax=Zhongshania sp. TaxID=1971902 RepID=UPI00356A6CC7